MVATCHHRGLVFLLCLGNFVNYGQTQTTSCKTPDNLYGRCVEIYQCKPMTNVLKTLQMPVPTRITQYLKAYKCGSGASTHMVCCPSSPIVLPTRIVAPENQDQPPDVTTHKNVYVLPSTCGYLDTSDRIVDGINAALNEFPWMALLRYKTKYGERYLCGGTIIHQNYILTAAHCLMGLSRETQLISVRVGEHSIKNQTDCDFPKDRRPKCSPPVQDVKVEEIIPHPQYVESFGGVNDIGLIRVSTINLNVENARPVCLPIGIVRDKPFRTVFVTGWGVSNITTGETSDILQKVGLPVTSKEQCAQLYNSIGISLSNTQICLGGNSKKDSCSGDSGGPMVVPSHIGDGNFVYVQQGIVSFGPKACGETDFPGVYTLVKFYMDWILDNLKP